MIHDFIGKRGNQVIVSVFQSRSFSCALKLSIKVILHMVIAFNQPYISNTSAIHPAAALHRILSEEITKMSLISDEEWAEFKAKFQKSYKDAAEEQMRRERYAISKALVEAHKKKFDAGEVTYQIGINHMADLTEEEYAMRCGKRNIPPTSAPTST